MLIVQQTGSKVLGISFPKHKKWFILTSVFIVHLSMNFNAAIYGNASSDLKAEFGVSNTIVKIGQMIFLVMLLTSITDNETRYASSKTRLCG